jgi:Mrp family chromosome partitioning ATPase
MRELLARLCNAFTYVLIDTPPVNAVSDASIVAAGASGTLLVVEQGRTTFPALGHAKQMLDRIGAHTVGTVMNKVRAHAGTYSYEYGYYAASSDGHDASDVNAPPESAESRHRASSSN